MYRGSWASPPGPRPAWNVPACPTVHKEWHHEVSAATQHRLWDSLAWPGMGAFRLGVGGGLCGGAPKDSPAGQFRAGPARGDGKPRRQACHFRKSGSDRPGPVPRGRSPRGHGQPQRIGARHGPRSDHALREGGRPGKASAGGSDPSALPAPGRLSPPGGSDFQQGRLHHRSVPRRPVRERRVQALGVRLRDGKRLPGHRPRPTTAAGELSGTGKESVAAEAYHPGCPRRRQADSGRLDGVRSAAGLDRLGSPGPGTQISPAGGHSRLSEPPRLQRRGPTATACGSHLRRRHGAGRDGPGPLRFDGRNDAFGHAHRTGERAGQGAGAGDGPL